MLTCVVKRPTYKKICIERRNSNIKYIFLLRLMLTCVPMTQVNDIFIEIFFWMRIFNFLKLKILFYSTQFLIVVILTCVIGTQVSKILLLKSMHNFQDNISLFKIS